MARREKYKSFTVKILRQSGLPVEPEAIKERRKAFDDLMSKLEAEHGKCTKDNSHLFQSALDSLEIEMEEKHPIVLEVDMPRSHKQWQDAIKKYGALGVINVDEKVTLLILDNVRN